MSSRAAASICMRGGTLRFLGDADDQSGPRHQRDAHDPEHRRRGARHDHRHARRRRSSTLTSNPPLEESRHPRADRLQPPGQRARHRRGASLAATAGGIATGFIAAPLGESIGRALDLDLFEITTTTTRAISAQGDRGPAGRRPGRSSSCASSSASRTPPSSCSIPARRVPAAQATAAPKPPASANRMTSGASSARASI